MRSYWLLLVLFLIPFTLKAQDRGVITISSEGSVELPADIIQFTVNLNAEGDSPQKAYNLHKEREKVLVQLLDKYAVEEEDINFEPVSVSKTNLGRPYTKEESVYQTRQMVSLRLSDFDVYEKIQISLIEQDFDNFSGNFLSTKAGEGKDTALQRAIRAAKEKAAIIAQEAGIKIGRIVGIDYSHRQIGPVYARSQEMLSVQSSDSQLMKYDQVVTVTANITIKFQIIR
ncbi:SIMPL domain-containing protein [Balneolaceae bacterium YR4-1]|uniref:SIMPL domain-containing protein n=1 Tax=Halalkalibaculum roseum TaxID=2709311 RepID=A0A6M1SV62_9BACT|nr:SIMPL domain-containing protein [Halalkalibaculum roseum]NGP76016.1 SIMPL domain-containing protein [Halalkalibaculum roseum]